MNNKTQEKYTTLNVLHQIPHKPLLSIIIPIFNEEATISILYQALVAILESLSEYEFEMLLINDGSSDNSWYEISRLAQQDIRIKAFNLSRNFGHQAALTAGYDLARGDAIITMDADMQDPPELIKEMIKQWQSGSHIVYARRIDRGDTFLKRITARVYYKFLDEIAEVKIPRNVGDFRLIDKKVLSTIQHCREKSRYLRGMVAWTGFTHSYVNFKRPNRLAGQTGYTWSKMFRLAFDGVTSFSLFPLKLAAFVGVFVVVTGSLMFTYITWDALLHQVYYPLFKWLVTIIYIFMGIQFLLLWLLGEYIGRIFEQQKGRPLYIVSESLGYDTKKETEL